jgi:predicted SAM-dependent methyltransferase
MTHQIVERFLRNPNLGLRSRQLVWYMTHRFTRWDRKLTKLYLSAVQIRKLHIGCGNHHLPGWLNMDYFPLSGDDLYLDARHRFFFDDGSFHYIFSEHMIEHISYDDGLNMISECRRVLRPGGKIRISTPDLSFLIDLYKPMKSSIQRQYIDWTRQEFFDGSPDINEVFVINYFMRNWGHTFIYDEDLLKRTMLKAGFTSLVKRNLHESEVPEFRNLENETRLPPGLLQLETITFEGTKPT